MTYRPHSKGTVKALFALTGNSNISNSKFPLSLALNVYEDGIRPRLSSKAWGELSLKPARLLPNLHSLECGPGHIHIHQPLPNPSTHPAQGAQGPGDPQHPQRGSHPHPPPR